jgi:hypothetical protein
MTEPKKKRTAPTTSATVKRLREEVTEARDAATYAWKRQRDAERRAKMLGQVVKGLHLILGALPVINELAEDDVPF